MHPEQTFVVLAAQLRFVKFTATLDDRSRINQHRQQTRPCRGLLERDAKQ